MKILLTGSLVLLTLASGSLRAQAMAQAPSSASAVLQDTSNQWDIGGTPRRWRELRPAGLRRPRALVLMLHGNGGSAGRLLGDDPRRAAPYRAWRDIALRERLWLVAPDGLPGPDGRAGWNDCRGDARGNPEVDDTSFLLELLARQRRAAGDPALPAFVVGTSNGGNMALRLAIERPEAFRAHAAIVAAMPARSECAAPTRPANLLFINGTLDRVLPFGGGEVWVGKVPRGSALGTLDSVQVWAALAGAGGAPRIETLPDLDGDGNTIERSVHAGRGRGARRHDVVLYTVRGGGHAEPSRRERLPPAMRQNGDVEAAEEAWAFFAPHLARR